jgi:hypothetical protein
MSLKLRASPTKATMATPFAQKSLSIYVTPGAKQTSSKAPAAPGIRSPAEAPGGSIEIRGAGGERATGTCLCVARAALFFACVRPPPPKNRKTDRSKKPKKTEKRFMPYIALGGRWRMCQGMCVCACACRGGSSFYSPAFVTH